MLTKEQGDQIIELLTQIRDCQAATAIIVEAAHAQQMVPVLEAQHLRAQSKMHLEASQREAERKAAAEALAHARRPRMFARQGDFGPAVVEELPEGESRTPLFGGSAGEPES